MFIPRSPEGGASGSAGSAGTTDDSSNNNVNDSKGTVSREDHQRAIDDMHKFKKEAADAKAQIKAIETEKLKATENYKALWEGEVEKHKATEKKLSDFSGWVVNDKRYAEVEKHALALGLRPEAVQDLQRLDLDDVPVETTSSGKFLVQGAKEKAEKLKAERMHWFKDPKAPNVNSGGGGTPPAGKEGKLTPTDVAQAERDWKRGKISKQDYENTHNRYCKENPRNAQPIVQDGKR